MDKGPDIPPRTSSKEEAKDLPTATATPSSSKEEPTDKQLTIPIRTSSQAATGTLSAIPKTPSPQKEATSQDELVLPDRYSDRLKPKQRRKLQKHRSKIERASMPTLSPQSSVSDFLEKKAQLLECDMNYRRAYEKFLQHAFSSGNMTNGEYQDEMDSVQEQYASKMEEQRAFEKQRRALEQDFEEAYEGEKRQKIASEANVEFLERAYATAIRIRGMSAGKQRKRHFNPAKFRKDVVAFYNASQTSPTGTQAVWCHLTGWHPPSVVKAAHLVPKVYDEAELEPLFGVGELVLENPKNGITLYKTIEEGLYNGIIAIVPITPADDHSSTKWKCVLVKENMKNDMVMSAGGGPPVKWKDFDGKELEFLSNNRPARRFLYFRFILTYLQSQVEQNNAWLEKVEDRKQLWASPGKYLRKSTLLSLSKDLTGKELPPSLYEGNTFDEKEPTGTTDIFVASHIRQALITTLKRTEEERSKRAASDENADDEDEESSENNDEEEEE